MAKSYITDEKTFLASTIIVIYAIQGRRRYNDGEAPVIKVR